MRHRLPIALLMLVVGVTGLRAGEVIDRIVLTVNGTAILQSDVDTVLHCEALLDGRSVASLSAADWQATLQRLTDQTLLRQEMGKEFSAPSAADLADRIRRIREQIPGAQTDAGWRQMLERYGLAQHEFEECVSTEMQLSGFIEQRLRPGIHIDADAVEAYYKEKLLPELKKKGVQNEPPLRQVRSQIENILTEQRMDQELSRWLRTLREQSRIRTGAAITPPARTGP